MISPKTLFLFIYLMFSQILFSQNTYFQQKYAEFSDGLSSRQITKVIQDKSGIIWIGTKNGLNRFDGDSYEHYYDFENNGLPALSSSTINDIEIDSLGNLWIATDAGLDVLNPYNFKVRRFTTDEIFINNPDIKKVMGIDILKNGRIFIKSYDFACGDYTYSCSEYIDSNFKQLTIFDAEMNMKYNFFVNIFSDNEGKTWIRPTNTLLFYQISKSNEISKTIQLPESFNGVSLSRFIPEPNSNPNGPLFGCNHLKSQQVTSSFRDGQSIVGIALKDTTFYKFLELNLNTQEIKEVTFEYQGETLEAFNAFSDKSGNYWFQNQKNIYKSNLKSTTRIYVKQLGKQNNMNSFFQSSDNTYWIGSDFGLLSIKETKFPFKAMFYKAPNQNGFGNSTRAIHVNDTNIYFSVIEDGIYKGNLKTGSFDKIIDRRYPSRFKTHEINAYGLHQQDGNLWISNRFDPGILKYNLSTGALIHLVDSSNKIGFGNCLLPAKKMNLLWQGTDKGLNIIDLINDKIKAFESSNPSNIQQYNITSLQELENDELLIGTQYSGVFVINKDNEFLKWLDKTSGLSSNSILSICESTDYYWIGTSNGLNRIEKKTKKIKIYNRNDGLLNNYISNVYFLNNHIWCSTNLGLSRLNIENNSFRNYTTENGLKHNEFNRFSSTKSSNNQLFFGGLNGVVQVDSILLEKEEFETKIILTGITKYDGEADSLVRYNYNSEEKVVFNPYDNSFIFRFTSTDYFNSEQRTYSYFIEGIDKVWTAIGNSHQVRLNRLPAGDYIFKVRTIGTNGLWTNDYLEVPFTIKQVFYKSYWFIALVFMATFLIIWFIYKYRFNQLIKLERVRIETEKLKSLDKTKTKFFNNVAHELRTPITLMTGHMETMLSDDFGGLNENQRKSVLVAKRNSERLMDLVTEILDLGKLESGKMELVETPVALKPFLNRLFFTFESLAHQFDISLKFDFNLDDNLTMLLDEPKIEKALNNLIHNAIKYTPRGGEIQLSAQEVDGMVHLQVQDNGKGILKAEQNRVFERYFQTEDKKSPAQGGTGIGLALVKEYIELHSGRVSLESEVGKGSVFILELPKSRITNAELSNKTKQHEELTFPSYPVLEKKDKTILVVDDHKEMQQYLKGVLGKFAKVIVANDGVEALDLLEKNKIDLLTIDLMMPNMDGSELLKQMKLRPEYAGLPTIMLTARSAQADKINALQIGVNDYITKPFSQVELIARIANLIENKVVREEEEQLQLSQKEESVDNQFIEKLRVYVNENLDSSELSVTMLAQVVGLSDKQLTRNVKRATGLTPLKFIREIKLLYAMEQLKSNNFHTVAEVSYAIGIDNPSHFSKIFKERFGKNPSEYLS